MANSVSHKMICPPLKAVDLFSGCGGLTQGLKDAGFEVCAAIEVDEKAKQTYEINHPEVMVYHDDIRNLSPVDLMREVGLQYGELDLLAGCPPCQGFSRLRTKNKLADSSDSRNDLILEFLRFIEVIGPKTIMLENVPALERDARFQLFKEKIHGLGYESFSEVLDAADYSVPQRRKRLILLASKVGKPAKVPPQPNRITVRAAISWLAAPSLSFDEIHAIPEKRSESVKSIMARIPKDGGSRSDLGENDQLPCHVKTKGFYDVYGRMAWDKVSPTITSGCHNPSKGRFIHPQHDRAITLREAALLQGFPVGYKFIAGHGKESIALMIGNALPPPFIKAHAGALIKSLGRG